METATTYIPPDLISEMDDEAIHARMLNNLPEDIDKTEGGFAYDFTRPAALEKAEMMITANEALQLFFPEWSYGAYLDTLAAENHITRKQATAAETYLIVTGADGKNIPMGYRFTTPSTAIVPNLEFETIEAVTIGETLTTRVRVRCTEVGTIGNVPANSITLMAEPMGGIMTITNPEPVTGGTDEEDDDALRARIMDYDRRDEASYTGCDADYKRWAQEVEGVGDVHVIPEWMGKGTGTVKLIILDANGVAATQSLMDAVYDHIMSENDRDARLAPIGAILTVATAKPLPIHVSANVFVSEDVDIVSITTAFAKALNEYFVQAKQDNSVKWTKVGSLLSETYGVLDYTDLTINDDTENIPIDMEHYPVADAMTFTEVR